MVEILVKVREFFKIFVTTLNFVAIYLFTVTVTFYSVLFPGKMLCSLACLFCLLTLF